MFSVYSVVGNYSFGGRMKHLFVILILLIGFTFVQAKIGVDGPRVAVLISKTSYDQHWGVTQMAAHGWGGVVNLAGIPYECLFVEDLASVKSTDQYDLMIFGQCGYLTEKSYNGLLKTLKSYFKQGGNVIIDGPLGLYDEKTRERDHSELDELLGMAFEGFKGNDNYRIRVIDTDHFITRKYEPLQYVTQHLVNGLNVQGFKSGGRTLLELTDENRSYPFLITRTSDKNRMVLVNDFSTWSGIPSFFRNIHPQVFFKNEIFNLLIQTVYWTLYGDLDTPIPSLQVSNAEMSAIIRLDGDASGNLDAQIRTINYLIDIARETGVVPLYTWVSSNATKAGWQDLAPLGKKLEDAGGVIGTHSKFHHIDQEMTPKRWQEELDDAIKEIEFNMSDYGYDIGKVDCFINPGNTIRMQDYGEVARRFGFYMTHGFEQDMPIGFGNFTWYNEKFPNFVVLENTPSPDYQWFYDPTWSYTTAQITAYEENIFDHLNQNIGRGVIFNEMWHDYSITSQPQYGKDRVMNKSNIAMYDGIKAKFRNNDIYCPDPYDLQNKLVMMAQAAYTWQQQGDTLDFQLDLGKVGVENVGEYTGGMGLRVNNSRREIQQVFINNREHFAFNDHVVILPNLTEAKAHIRVVLGKEPEEIPHLRFVSKRMPALDKTGSDLSLKVLTKSRAKFTFICPTGYILLNADGFEWGRTAENELRGFVTSDRTVTLKALGVKDLCITSTDMRFGAVTEGKDSITMQLTKPEQQTGIIKLKSGREIKSVTLEEKEIQFEKKGQNYTVELGKETTDNNLTINF